MPLHGWEKDVLLPSNWFFKKIQWKGMGGRERRATCIGQTDSLTERERIGQCAG